MDGKQDFDLMGWIYEMAAKQRNKPIDPFKDNPEIKTIIKEYERKTGKRAPGINCDELPAIEDYKRYLIDFVEKEYEKMRKEGKGV